MTESASNVFRDFNTPGVPASGEYAPDKVLVRRWGREIEAAVGAAQANGGLIFDTKSNLDGSLAHAANTSAWVIEDATVANNGIYRKSGGSGSGSWSKVADLPYSFIALSDVGAGTPNAIQATSDIPPPSGPYRAIMLLSPYEANTGPVTIAVNGDDPKPLKTNSGNDLAAEALTAGMALAFVDDGTNCRLLSDVASASIQAASEEASQIAVDARDEAEELRDETQAIATGVAAIVGQIEGINVWADEGIAEGNYPATRSARASATFTKIFAEIMEGTGTALIRVLVNGVEAYSGTVTSGTPLTVSGLSIAVVAGDAITFSAIDFSDSILGLWAQIST